VATYASKKQKNDGVRAAAAMLDAAAIEAAGEGAARVISDCHFAVHLSHFIPGFLSYSVAVSPLK
jgi:hypothetical protein